MYTPSTDFLSLSRATASGVVLARAPGLDIIVNTLSRAGLFSLHVGQTAPTSNQSTTAWLQPAQPSWSAEATLWLWNATDNAYELATPALWSSLLEADTAPPTPAATLVFETVAKAQATTIVAPQVSFMVLRFAAGYPAEPATYAPGASGGPNAFQDAGGRFWQLDLSGSVHWASWYGVNGDGGDYTTQLQKAVSFSSGHEVRLPFGTIGISAAINSTTTVQGVAGLRLTGCGGFGQTIVDNRIPNGPAAALIVHGSPSAFAYGAVVRGIKFITTTSSAVTFLDILAEYTMLIEDCQFTGNFGNGVSITSNLGDADAVNTIVFKRCFFTGNVGTGLLSNNAPTVVQTSFVRCEDCFFSQNGLTGWFNVGLSSSMYNCVFTENGSGVSGLGGLFVANNSAGNAQFTAINCSFENNYVGSIRLNALAGAEFINCEIAGGTPPIVSTVGVQLNGCTKVHFQGTRMRIGAALNPFTAFSLAGSSDCVFGNTDWVTFDAAGQVRFAEDVPSYGNRFDDSFSSVQEGQDNGLLTINFVNGANQNVVVPNTGTTFSISGPTAAFNVGGLTNGQPGRRIRLINGTGFTATFNDEDAGSIAANRIWAGAGGRAVINHTAITLEYNSLVSRWVTG